MDLFPFHIHIYSSYVASNYDDCSGICVQISARYFVLAIFIAFQYLSSLLPFLLQLRSIVYGHWVFSRTLVKIGHPLITCHPNSPIPAKLAPMWTVRAVSFPFCIAGTQNTATAQRQVSPAPTYRWGPGKSFPVRAYVLSGPWKEKKQGIKWDQ